MKNRGFTLAEVLITLAIIGVVAALTIPSVIVNTQQQEFKTGLKKAVSVLNEAIQTNIAMDGETPYDRADLTNNGTLEKYLTRHMAILKLVNGDWTGFVNISENETGSSFRNTAFYTTDGMRFEVANGSGTISSGAGNIKLHESGFDYKSSYDTLGYWMDFVSQPCGSYGLSSNQNNTKFPPCLILVDVNGDKKPTVYGSNMSLTDNGYAKKNYEFPSPNDKKLKDIFLILITDEKAIPFGVVAQRAMYSK